MYFFSNNNKEMDKISTCRHPILHILFKSRFYQNSTKRLIINKKRKKLRKININREREYE